jgi:xylulokinase
MRTLVAGVDSSTQSTKVVVCDAETGELVREGRAPHPDATEVHPDVWWSAYGDAVEGGLLEGVTAISVAGQQHGMVALDNDREVVRPALLWNDTRSADAAHDLVAELGGAAAWAEAVGSVPVASFTATKLRWLASHEPSSAARVTDVVLPHDWLTYKLRGGGAAVPHRLLRRPARAGLRPGPGYAAGARAFGRGRLVPGRTGRRRGHR